VRLWKDPLKWIGGLGMILGAVGIAFHYLRYGPKEAEIQGGEDERRN